MRAHALSCAVDPLMTHAVIAAVGTRFTMWSPVTDQTLSYAAHCPIRLAGTMWRIARYAHLLCWVTRGAACCMGRRGSRRCGRWRGCRRCASWDCCRSCGCRRHRRHSSRGLGDPNTATRTGPAWFALACKPSGRSCIGYTLAVYDALENMHTRFVALVVEPQVFSRVAAWMALDDARMKAAEARLAAAAAVRPTTGLDDALSAARAMTATPI